MDADIKDSYISKIIKKYPFNGRSNYLIDKFYIIGYNIPTLHKILFEGDSHSFIKNENIINIKRMDSDEKKANNFHSFNLKENPTILNEFTSDHNKECLNYNILLEMIFPNKINLYYSEEEKSFSIDKGKKKKQKNDFVEYEDILIESDLLKQKCVVFSSNPQTENNGKKSINGFGFIFYKKLRKRKMINDKMVSFYIPITFCIISEFPFYNSFYKLCETIKMLFTNSKKEIPIEILLYCIIKQTPSPINRNILLSLRNDNHKESDNNINLFMDTQKKNEKFEILLNSCKKENDNLENKPKKFLRNTMKNKMEQYEKKIDRNFIKQKSKHLKFIDDNDTNTIIENQKFGYSPVQKKNRFIKDINYKNNAFLQTINETDSKKSSELFISKYVNNNESKKYINCNYIGEDNILFEVLPGYPLIQYNLAKVLLSTLSPINVIEIFFYTFLEKDVIFFSKYLQYLSLTINSYLNLNFPLNEEKYYFINASVSYENYINNNSTFVGATFTSIIGINDKYNPNYINSSQKLKEHLAVDLDKGIIYMNEDQNDKEKSMKNKVLFDYIKKICRKEIKDDKIILAREVKILFEKLEQYKNENTSIENKLSNNFMSMSSRNIIRINERNNGYNNFIDYDERGRNSIKNKNRNIQEGFYRLINYISLYFYQNLSLKSDDDKSDLNKIIINRKKKGLNTDDMNIIFHKDYVDNVYIKEEMYLLDELMETMKFESFVYGFVQSYNPIDLYKIPLTMAEEFISILSRKNSGIYLNINFFSLIDNIYKKNGVEKIYIDFNPFSVEYYKKLKKYFDREIYDENNDNNNLNKKKVKEKYLKIKIKETNEGKTIDKLKYSEFILDNNLLLKYILLLKNIKKEEYYRMFHLASTLEQSKIKSISIIDIENEVEKYTNNINLSTKRDICSSNIILLFILSIKSIKNYIDCQSFLSCLFHNFIISRKYYTLIMKLLYRLIMICIEKEDYHNANNYFFCYYSCINSLRNMKIVPNENLMNIISKFNQIDLNDLLEKKNNCKKIEESDKNLDEHMNNIVQMDKYIYVIYNYMKNSFIKEKNIIQKLDEIKGKQNLSWIVLNKEGIEKKIQPKIKFNNGAFQYECYIYSQDKILDDLNKQYEIYSKNLDENKLDNKILFEACLNIILFARNTNFFPDADDLFEVFKIIFNVYLFKIMNTRIENESNTEIKE